MNGFYQRLRQLHLILGLTIGLLLWLIVFAGSLSFYRAELDSWQLAAMAASLAKEQSATKVQSGTKLQSTSAVWPEQLPTAEHSTALALAHLQQVAPDAGHWYIELPQPRSPYVKLHWQQQGERPQLYQQFLQPETGEALQEPWLLRFGATEHQLGGWFFQLHYNLLQLAGSHSRTLVAFAALFWLLLSISGLLSLKGHWRYLFKANSRLADQQKQQNLQRHHQLALLTLPFALLFASTGWLTQMFSENSAPQQVLYPQNPYQFYTELFPMQQPAIKAEGALHALPDLKPMLQAATEVFTGAAVGKISISAPGRSNSTVLLSSSAHSRIGNQATFLLFQLQPVVGNNTKNTAQLVWQQVEMAGVATPAASQTQPPIQSTTKSPTTPVATLPLAQLRQLAYGLHQSLYANTVLRFLLFVSGLLCCWMIWLGLTTALKRLAAGRWQQLLLLLSALPGSVVLAAILLIVQSGLWSLPWSLSQLFLLYWAVSFLVLFGCFAFSLRFGTQLRPEPG